jgi:hypothetical protein
MDATKDKNNFLMVAVAVIPTMSCILVQVIVDATLV